ncbi:hypothetical protein HY251_15345 [bacterium]|nr:hypothetical protein [bacterium]
MSPVCRRMRELIPLFAGSACSPSSASASDLEPSEAALVREHVASCAACAADLGVYVAQAARFQAVREERPRVDLWEGIQRRLAEPEPARVIAFTSADRSLRRALAVAAGLVLAFGFFAYERGAFRGSPAEQPLSPDVASKEPTPAPTNNAPVLVKHEKTPAPRRIAPRLPRTIFEDNSADFHVAEERELIPMDDDAFVPATGKGYGHLEAEPEAPARPSPRKNTTKKPEAPSERSLRF